jgi:ATP-dependent Clp protease ATP-binding subunit ClpB
LSNRYITDRFLPDKAIDLVDEAASRIKMELDSKPTELDQLDRQILQLEIERTSLAKEKDAASKERLKLIDKETANLKDKSKALTVQWQNEKAAVNAVSIVQSQLEQAKLELEKAQRAGGSEQVGGGPIWQDSRTGEEAGGQMEKQTTPAGKAGAHAALLRQEVTDEDIARVVAAWTHIPVSRMLEGERAEAAEDGGAAGAAGHRPAGGDQGGGQRGAAFAQRVAGPEPAHRLVHLSRPDGRGQDGDGARAGGIFVR